MKLLLLIPVMFLLIPLAFATYGEDAEFGDNYSTTASDYIAFDRFNRADNSDIGNLETGQAWLLEGAENEAISNGMLYFQSGEGSDTRPGFAQSLEAEYTDVFTLDIIMFHPAGTSSSHGMKIRRNDDFDLIEWGTIWVGDDDIGYNDESGGGRQYTTPTFDWTAATDTTILVRLVVDTSETINMTIFNFSVTDGVITLDTLGILEDYSSGYADDLGRPRIVGDRRLNLWVTEIAIYNGTIRPPAAVPTPPGTGGPVEMSLINLSSEGGTGQIIYNQSSGHNNKLNNSARTNDTTPTFRATINESGTCALYVSPRLNRSNISVVGLYTLDQNASDESQHGFDGTCTNFEAGTGKCNGTSGIIGNSILFDGDDDYVDITSGLSTVEGLNAGTISVWYRSEDTSSTNAVLFSISDKDAASDFVDLFVLSENSLRFAVRRATDVLQISQDDGTTYKDQQWHHIAVVTGDGDNRIYVDGVRKAVTFTFGDIGTNEFSNINNPDTMRIGSRDISATDAFARGSIDELNIWNVALNHSEVIDIYKNGLSPDLNYSTMIKQVPDRVCSTTGGVNQICTAPVNDTLDLDFLTKFNERRTGMASGFIACKDGDGNENRTSTSGMYLFNVTDFKAPNSTIHTPVDGSFYVLGINNTINYTISGLDNLQTNFSHKVYLDNVLIFTNTSYINGTNVSYYLAESGLGTHTVYVNATDSYNNLNQSFTNTFTVQKEETVDLFFDLVNDTRKYELNSFINISANCTQATGLSCLVEIDLNAPRYGYNFSSNDNFTSFIFNISTLRIVNFSNGPGQVVLSSSDTLNITSNNRTIMTSVKLNVTSSGTTTNLNITYLDKSRIYKGDLKSIYLTDDEFVYEKSNNVAVNITHTVAGSSFISYNLSDLDFPINMTFRLTGFDLDADNEFIYNEHYNISEDSKSINYSLSFNGNAPTGIFDDFNANNSRWSIGEGGGGGACSNSYGDGFLKMTCGGGSARELAYSDLAGDLRNSSHVNFWMRMSGFCSVAGGSISYIVYATDGTSYVSLKDDDKFLSDQSHIFDVNVSLNKRAEDYKKWDAGGGATDISSLDFTKQISLIWRIGTGVNCNGALSLYNINWSGGWLNRSVDNGTYNSIANITSNILNVTKTNISKATLTWESYETDDTEVQGYLSNNCNATNTLFSKVSSGVTHTYVTKGNKPCVRFVLNSTDNLSSPVVRKYEFDITQSSVENISVERDDINIFTYTGVLNGTTGSIFVNITPLSNQINTFKISSDTPGLIQIDQFLVNSSINQISLNYTSFEYCSNCVINYSFSGNTITVNSLEWDFLGSHNYSATARFGTLEKKLNISIYYSNFNTSLPDGYPYYDVFLPSGNVTNITPYLQTDITPIWNITNQAYDQGIDIYVKTNKSLNSCVNVTYTNNSLRAVEVINESFTSINGTSIRLANNNLVNGSGVIFNQTGSYSTKFLIDAADGTITLLDGLPANLPDNAIRDTEINMSGNVLLMHFDGNSTLDSSGKNNHGTAVGGANVTPLGQINDGYLLDGVNDWIRVKDSDILSFGDESTDKPFSIGMWVNSPDLTSFRFAAKTTISPDEDEWRFYATGGNTFLLELYDSTLSAGRISATSSSTINQFENVSTHFAATYDGSGSNTGLTLYVNGSVFASSTGSSGSYTAMHNFDANLSIGASDADSGADFADGTIDEVFIFNRTLSATEVNQIYQQGNGTIIMGSRQQFGINYSYLTYGFDDNVNFTFRLNESYQQINKNITVDNSAGVWNWWDLYGCSNRFELPYVFFASICSDCYFQQNMLDNFTVIIE